MDALDLIAKLKLDMSEYEAGLATAQQSATGLGTGMKTAMKVGAVAVTACTTAVAGFASSAVSAGQDFDSSMSQVAATMGYTVAELNDGTSEAAQNMETLRDFAQQMGASTAFSATEAADALNYMALAGYDAETSMEMLPTVLDLAAAGGMDLASASDMVTDASSALNLSMDETTALVDQMAAAASSSNTSVDQLGEAILTVGATAANMSGGTAELATILGVLGDNGIKGAEGGTHLRNMLLSLQDAAVDGSVAFSDDLSVSIYDAEGNMRNMVDIIGDMQTGLEGMSQESKDAIISGVFNKTDLASVNALLNTSTERFEELGDAITDSEGAAASMAEVQLDNLAGDITLFQSALEGAKIAVSDELTPTLREFVQFGTEGLSELTTAFQEDGITGAMSAFGNLLSELIAKITTMLPEMVDAGASLLESLLTGIINNLPLMAEAALTIIENLASGLGESASTLIPTIANVIVSIVDTLVDGVPDLVDAGLTLLLGVVDGITTAIPIIVAALPELISSVVSALLESSSKILQAGIQLFKALVEAIPEVRRGCR